MPKHPGNRGDDTAEMCRRSLLARVINRRHDSRDSALHVAKGSINLPVVWTDVDGGRVAMAAGRAMIEPSLSS